MMRDEIQAEMLRLEAGFHEKQPPLLECVRQLVGLDMDEPELLKMLDREITRVRELARDYYGPMLNPASAVPHPAVYAGVGFLQGVTFATAVAKLKRDGSP